MRALKSLPDEGYIVWHRLSIWETPGPDFMVLKDGRQVAFIKVSMANKRDAARMSQPELLPAIGNGNPMGEREREALNLFTQQVMRGSPVPVPKNLPKLIAYPNLREVELRDALRHKRSNGTDWFSGERLAPNRFLKFVEGSISEKLTSDCVDELRKAFTPEVVIPADFTVREPIKRHTSAALSEYLLDYDQEWLLKVDLDLSEQARQTSQNFSVRLVNGVAGSGKSLIIVYRAHLLQRLFPKKRILVLTHNRPLIRDLQARYERMSEGGQSPEWQTFLSWCMSLFPNEIEIEERIGQEAREKLIQQICHELLEDTTVTPTMLESEIDWLKDRLIFKRSDYLVADRTGRGFALQESIRQRVYEAMLEYHRRLSEDGMIDWGHVPRKLWKMLEEGTVSPELYDVILVDEAQFFAPIWFEIIKRMIKPLTGHLFLVADPTQGFLKRGESWISSGLEVRGRSQRLDRSYRTTRQILDFATVLYRSRIETDAEDIVLPNMLDMPDGVVPVILPLSSPQDEISRVVNEIHQAVKEGIPKGHFLVIHANWKGVKTIIQRLNKVLGNQAAMDPKDAYDKDKVRVCTINAVTGLESSIVFLVGLHELHEQEQSLRISEEERMEMIRDNTRKIYMAITRAGQRVVITYCGEMPDWLRVGQGA
jgi:hypothetical protein